MRRSFWEFQAVVAGEIAPRSAAGVGAFSSRALWVSAPGHSHLWAGRADAPAEVVVFHFTAPEPELAELVQESSGMLRIDLLPEDVERLKCWHDSVSEEYVRPNGLTHLKVRRILDGLTLLVLDRAGFQARALSDDIDRERVDAARYWYERSLPSHPQVSDVAAAIGVSEVHLRRIFAKQLGRSPKAIFQEILFAHAERLLTATSMTLEAIAADCGYANASSFSRAYKAFKGEAPGRRRSQVPVAIEEVLTI
jgi:AraC-like DNA-binding protein